MRCCTSLQRAAATPDGRPNISQPPRLQPRGAPLRAVAGRHPRAAAIASRQSLRSRRALLRVVAACAADTGACRSWCQGATARAVAGRQSPSDAMSFRRRWQDRDGRGFAARADDVVCSLTGPVRRPEPRHHWVPRQTLAPNSAAGSHCFLFVL